jgi:predicted alpha/beta-fold hydrolase
LDDPFIGHKIGADAFLENPNVVLATTKYGGHIGYQENIFRYEIWIMKPLIVFLQTIAESV